MSVPGSQNPAHLAQHPKFYNAKVEPGMKLPGDFRQLRDVKLYEVPKWFATRNWSPLGMWFGFKRWRHGLYSKYVYVRRPNGVLLAQAAFITTLAMYIFDYRDIKLHKRRKYH